MTTQLCRLIRSGIGLGVALVVLVPIALGTLPQHVTSDTTGAKPGHSKHQPANSSFKPLPRFHPDRDSAGLQMIPTQQGSGAVQVESDIPVGGIGTRGNGSMPDDGTHHRKQKKQTGFYLVLAEDSTAKTLPPPNGGQQIIRYDYRLLPPEERGPVKYLLIAKRPDVVLVLRKPPVKLKGEGGRTQLLLEATDEGTAQLANLTSHHLGEHVAFVVSGEIVSTHTIRSAITDGKFRISRCTDDACEYIYGELTK